jgi:protein-tyrosine phosphatase
MLPLVDIHCHLLAGLDDGPKTPEDALAMCQMAYEEGTRLISALAHQNERYPENTPDAIRTAALALKSQLSREGVALTTVPCAEVMAHLDIHKSWTEGKLLSLADRKQYLLVEMPDGQFVDLRDEVSQLGKHKLRVVLAHPERHPEFLHMPARLVEMIQLGCLVQVSTDSITDTKTRADLKALQVWFRRDMVHAIGSDGHSPRRRQPRMAEAYQTVCRWAGTNVADRVFSTNGMAILQGLPIRFRAPQVQEKRWFAKLFG